MERIGSYGMVSILWEDGYEIGEVPDGYFEGIMSPVSGSLTMTHGQDEASIQILVSLSGFCIVFKKLHRKRSMFPIL